MPVPSAAARGRFRLDRGSRVVVLAALAGLAFVFLVAFLAPPPQDDPVPTVWNQSRHGAKAALLLLQELGYRAGAFEQPLDRLPLASAKQTTLILAAPSVSYLRLPAEQQALRAFLRSGGTVLATGLTGAMLLGRTDARPSTHLGRALCLTQPEGFSRLARAGSLRMPVPAAWGSQPATDVEVAQRCGSQPVVVRWRSEGGTAIWWSSAAPLSNEGLHDPADLRLLLASTTPPAGEPASGRIVLFDEYFHGVTALGVENPLAGLPLPLLLGQAALVLLLLVFSFSRRHGPVFPQGAAPHTSSLEFTTAMGALYHRAEAWPAAVATAQNRLQRALRLHAAVPHTALAEGPQAVADSLAARYGPSPEWLEIADLLRQGAAAQNDAPLRERDTLALVRSLDRHTDTLTDPLRLARTL